MAADIPYLHRRWQSLVRDRRPWETAWQDLAQHFLPTRCRLHGKKHTPLLNGNIVDATGILAMRTLAAGLHGGMTSPARPWFRLGLDEPDTLGDRDARHYLDTVAERMRGVFARSNFYNAVHTLYAELATFGTACMFAQADVEKGFCFLPLTVGEYALDVGADRTVDTLFRRFQLTPRQLASTFGHDALPEAVQRQLERGTGQESLTVIHAVLPRADAKSGHMQSAYMPYASLHWLEGASSSSGGGRYILRESGYEEFPVFAPRWDCVGNDVYGHSPAMDALPDCRMLQQMGITTLKGIHKAVDPPMSVSASLKSVGLDLTPGGINYVDSAPGQTPQAAAPLLHTNPDIAQARKAIEMVQQQVRAGLYNDLFRLIMDGRSGVTASEIAAREEEKIILIGPVLERLQHELFHPLIKRTYNLMKRLDMLPPVPPRLQATPMKVEFISLLAQAQKLVSTSSVREYLAFTAKAAAAWPEALDSVNIDVVMDRYAEHIGLETSLLRSQEERQLLRQQRI